MDRHIVGSTKNKKSIERKNTHHIVDLQPVNREANIILSHLASLPAQNRMQTYKE